MILKVLTPQGVVFEQAVDEVRAPGVEGEFTVLPGHIPFVTTTNAGILRWRAGTAQGQIQVEPGFVQVNALGEVSALVQSAAVLLI